jgi:hypothetical protein
MKQIQELTAIDTAQFKARDINADTVDWFPDQQLP